METFQTIIVMLAFGTFILALLTYIEKRKNPLRLKAYSVGYTLQLPWRLPAK
ncbi:putative holin-like toxin [Paenibacillus sp. Soil766]|uniref:putative holin-like toxin n=1 Tax=Paenibacillus sp. Soil766 TaxID=1736404 RepID=UPI000A702760|nr:putative holin-like toxin [Paenibacillus sp. Soil766]